MFSLTHTFPLADLPSGFTRRSHDERVQIGDIVADSEGRWRGPVSADWSGLGNRVVQYRAVATRYCVHIERDMGGCCKSCGAGV